MNPEQSNEWECFPLPFTRCSVGEEIHRGCKKQENPENDRLPSRWKEIRPQKEISSCVSTYK